MKTIEQRITKKAEAVARRHSNDIESILVYVNDDAESEGYGLLYVEFNVWSSSYKDENGNLRSHDHANALREMENWLAKVFGLFLHYDGDGTGEGVGIHVYTIAFCKDK